MFNAGTHQSISDMAHMVRQSQICAFGVTMFQISQPTSLQSYSSADKHINLLSACTHACAEVDLGVCVGGGGSVVCES